uniref:ZBR-type domain-containing protein n=1 Tax=Periophthalmus magnuspinnatus TaxID=409849 RepID=A0A3B4BH71_9GOBI
MQCTPEPNVFFNSDKERACYDDCFDSGYSGLFYTPQSITRDGSLSLGESDETPKENLRLSAAPKDRTRFWNKDRAACWPSTGLCETPRLYKRDASLQHRLALCKSILDVKANPTKSPNKSLSNCVSGQWLSTSLDSLDTVIGTLSTSTLALDQDIPLSGRKRRHLYSQVRTSTLEDGQATFEQLSSFDRRVSLSDKSLHSPACNDLSDSSVLYTPSSLDTPNYTRYVFDLCVRYLRFGISVCEDSGFSSLTLDKSQDSSVDHDGSFQELLLSASKGNSITPNLLDTKRRPRLQRQNRLSTLKEGGSQSEDDPTERSKQGQQPLKEDEVFTGSTPFRALSIKPRGSVSFENSPPSRNTPLNLSMTPALQLVHAMCQQKAQALNGQSPSLKDELRSTAALVHTPVTFRTTMPLAGLIGRKIGVGTVDILTELNKRNLKHILSLILGLLTPKCIYRWDLQSLFIWHKSENELNSSLEVRPGLGKMLNISLLKRSALKTVQSQSRSQSFCTPQSSSRSATPLHNSTFTSASSSKRDKFIEVAKTLFNDECLKPCPRCQHPARCHSVKGEGVCSSADCGFQFCTSCLCAFHGSKECGSQSVNRRKKDVLIPGSAQSKRNIRRL